jgi:hypothetical protein
MGGCVLVPGGGCSCLVLPVSGCLVLLLLAPVTRLECMCSYNMEWDKV